jgi:dolichol-phosphate mannosyltransferase
MDKYIEISIVATIYNDEALVPYLVEAIQENVKRLNVNYEIILVNDCSTDKSKYAIEKVCHEQPNVKGINLSRNYGQQIAMSAGIRFTSGKFVIIMDGDLQNPPSEIQTLYNEILKGFDIVYTVSEIRNNFMDKITSIVFWNVLTKIFGVQIIKNQLMLKIMTREFINRYNSYNEINRTVAGIVNDISGNFQIIKVMNNKRPIGKGHYNFFKRFNLFIDILISLSNAPLNMMIYFGWLIFLLTIILSVYYLIEYMFFDVPIGFTSLILSIFFFGSLIILLLGYIGRYLSNIYTEVRQRPLFHVSSFINFQDKI